jgi:hypothetical protein
MPTKASLIGLGMPAALANRLGMKVNSVTGVGTSQSSGPTLEPNSVNLLTTAGGATACTLPATAEIGDMVEVHVISATTGLVFPDTGATIDLGTATTGSVATAQNKGRVFRKVADLTWKSMLGS